jgi:hypothetical protein
VAVTCTVPAWVQYLQALLTPAIAFLAVVIAYFQMRTANQRAALDVFDKRFDTYQRARAAIAKVMAHGSVNLNVLIEFARAVDEAQFLFGHEVTSYLLDVHKLLAEHGEAEEMMKSDDAQTSQNAVKKKHAAFKKIAEFYAQSTPLVMPYMRQHQKAPRTWTAR